MNTTDTPGGSGDRDPKNGSTPGDQRGRPRLGDLKDPRVQLPATVARNERIVEDGFWPKLRRLAGRLPFVEDLVAAYFCAMDPRTPWKVRAVLLAALAYFVIPLDFIPDILAGLGYLDDAGVIYAAIRMVAEHITPEHRAQARKALSLPDADDP